ncbi:hypothetical protein [Bacillus sp. PK3_68]|uniref:hypothetical protein n=1 Tax=Bacillus sp. PK3_68 TaxID=2027408 RepID=UPI0016040525|nr:hypothetical protein [Bacillus sp. PK3_68]
MLIVTHMNFLQADLEKNPIVQLSVSPDIPAQDETINHKVLKYEVLDTKTGSLLLLQLRNLETGEEYTYSFPDIKYVEQINNNKYYLHCLNRNKIDEFNQTKKITDSDFFESAPTFIYRILIF